MKLRRIVGGFCLAMMGFVGCRDVTYNIVKVGNSEAETPKPFIGLSEATYYEKNNGQLVVPVDEDISGGYDSIPSNYKYRIPTSVVIPAGAILPNGQKIGNMGRLVVSGDARWGNSAVGGGLDLPQKASAWSRYSDDGGKTWSRMELTVHYDDLDMSTFTSTNVRWGVVTGDPTIGRTATNRLIMLTTFAPPAVGLHMGSGGGFGKTGDAYFQVADGCGCNHSENWCRCEDSTWYLRLRKNSKNYSGMLDSLPDLSGMTGVSTPPVADSFSDDDWSVEQYNADDSVYTYFVDVKGGEIKKGSANGSIAGASGTGLYVDENYFVYLDEAHQYPLYVNQLVQDGSSGSDRNAAAAVKLGSNKVHCHLFMAMSPYLPWRGCNYIGMSYSDDGGVTWSENKDITYMVRPKENSSNKTGFFFVSPTGGYLHEGVDADKATTVGNNNRLLYSAYKGQQNEGGKGQQAVVFWTDDNGETWTHATSGGGSQGAYIGENGTCASETTIVGHPSGALIAIGRGAPPQYAVSLDGGETWTAKGALPNSNGKLANSNLVSATRLWLSTSPTGDPLIALTSATITSPRSYGKLYICTIKKDGDSYTIDPYWAGGATVVDIQDPSNVRFDYSNVRELPDGNLTVVFESNECNDLLLAYVDVLREE